MRYVSSDLGQLERGTVVEVNLTGSAANVRLLDAANFSAYRLGQRHRYIGGYYTKSPARLQVPSHGHWFVAVDYGGNAGRGTGSVRILART